MAFSSMLFLFVFLPVLLVLYFAVPKNWFWLKNAILIIFSLIFYASNEPKLIVVMLGSVLVNYFFALGIDKTRLKKVVFIVSMVFNLGMLVYYKYTNFIWDNIQAVTGTSRVIEQVVMPAGISFFTFQSMSYIIDVYMGKIKAEKNPFNIILYIFFFPQLIQGPIIRYGDIRDDIEYRQVNTSFVAEGISTFIIGLGKKILISNQLSVIADTAFAEQNINFAFAWLGIIAYTLQLYFDFSGYTDMAIGLGKIFGFNIPQNFNYPYVAQSITDFWRRWHITLSTWFRDYIYIPLGGNRCSKLKHFRNIMAVWLATGIWHGASWNFVVWGVYYGVILILEKELFSKVLNKVPRLFRHIYTIFIVLIGFVFFRATTLTHALEYIGAMFTFKPIEIGASNELLLLKDNLVYLILGIIGSIPVAVLFKDFRLKPLFKFVCCTGIFLICILYLTSSTFKAFLYFGF